MATMNIWRAAHSLDIENACMLLVGLDPWEEDISLKLVAHFEAKKQAELPSVGIGWVDQGDIFASEEPNIELKFDESEKAQQARRQALRWLSLAKKAVAHGELAPHGPVFSYDKKDAHPVTNIDPSERLHFNVTRAELARWMVSLGWAQDELPEFLHGVGSEQAKDQHDADDIRALEAMGLLVEAYIRGRGPGYRHGDSPKISRIVDDMLDAKPEDVTKMSKRKLQDIVGDALKAWEAKKRL